MKKHQQITPPLLIILILLSFMKGVSSGVPFIPQMEQDYDKDVEFCEFQHPDLNLLPVTLNTNSTNEEIDAINEFKTTAPSTAQSKNLKFIIRQDLSTYFKTNLGDTIVWVLFFSMCFFSFCGCVGYTIYRLFKKEKVLLNSKQLEDALEKQKEDAEQRLRLKENTWEDSGSESSDSESEDLEEINNPRKMRYKIIIYVKIGLLFFLAGSLYLVDKNFIDFFQKYILISCKFTYTNQVLLQGDERNQNIKFLGMDQIKNQSNILLQYYENTTTSEFKTELQTLESHTQTLLEGLEKIYQNFKTQTIRSPSTGLDIELDFFQNWGPTTEYDSSTGILKKYADFVRKNYQNLTQSLEVIKQSPLPPLRAGFFSESATSSPLYTITSNFINATSALRDKIQEYYNYVSLVYFTRTYEFEDFGTKRLLFFSYGLIILVVILGLMTELLFYRLRHSKCLKHSIALTWIIFTIFTSFYTTFLMYMSPISNSLLELTEVISSANLNKTFYSQIESPSHDIRYAMHSCFFRDGSFQPGSSFLSNPITEPLQMAYNAISNALEASSPSSTSQVLIEFNNLKSILTDYENFNSLLYNPNDSTNPSTILRKLNAVTDCNSAAYTEYGENVNFNNDCSPTVSCHSSDVWVWDLSQCPPGSIPWTGGAVDTSTRWCMNFGEDWATQSAVHNRYAPAGTTCTNSGTSYKDIATEILTKLKAHHTDVQAKMSSLKTSLDNVLSPNTATGIGTINTLITSSLVPKITSINSELEPIMSLTLTNSRALGTHLNCSFIREILREIYPDLKSVNEGMLTTSYMSLGAIFFLLLLSLGSFILGQCFPRVKKLDREQPDRKQLKTSTNKIVPIDRTPLQRLGTGDIDAQYKTKVRRPVKNGQLFKKKSLASNFSESKSRSSVGSKKFKRSQKEGSLLTQNSSLKRQISSFKSKRDSISSNSRYSIANSNRKLMNKIEKPAKRQSKASSFKKQLSRGSNNDAVGKSWFKTNDDEQEQFASQLPEQEFLD